MIKLFNTLIAALLIVTAAEAKLKETDKQFLAQPENLLSNPGGENGVASWTATGSSVLAVSSTDPLEGKNSLTWDASATGEFLESGDITIKEGQKGRECEAVMEYSWNGGSAGDLKLQVFDGTLIKSTVDLLVTDSNTPTQTIRTPQFSCATSGTLEWRLASTADAAIVKIDTMHLGKILNQVLTGGAELVVSAKYVSTASCFWDRSDTSLGPFSTTAACPSITVAQSTQVVNTADNNLPDIVFDSLKPGLYVVRADLSGGISAETAHIAKFILDVSGSVTASGSQCGFSHPNNTSASKINSISCDVSFQVLTSGAVTIAMHGASSAGTIRIRNATAFAGELNFTITRFPLGSERATTFDITGWHIDANIGGANVNLGLSSIDPYGAITDAGLDLVLNAGSAAAEIGCASGTAPSGLTCSSDESISIAFLPPWAGLFEVCMDFTYGATADSGIAVTTTFQLIETGLTNVTIGQLGNTRTTSKLRSVGSSDTTLWPIHNCGIFNFTSVDKKIIRLFVEQLVVGALSSSQVFLDRLATAGQRDLHVTVRPWTKNFANPVINNTMTSTDPNSVRVGTATFKWVGGVPIVQRQDGVWISSITDSGTGLATINFAAGIFSSLPNCFCSSGSTTQDCTPDVENGTTSIRIVATTNATDAPVDSIENQKVMCVGIK